MPGELDPGYTRIAHRVEDLFKRGVFTKQESQIIWTVIQWSWGWNAGESNWTAKPFKIKDFAEETGLCMPCVSETLKSLVRRNIIQRDARPDGIYYSFNEHPDRWLALLVKSELPRKSLTTKRFTNKLLVNHKEIISDSLTSRGQKLNSGAGFDAPKERKEKKKKQLIDRDKGANQTGEQLDELIPDSDPGYKRVVNCYLDAVGLNFPSPNDKTEIKRAIHDAKGDVELLCSIITKRAEGYTPKHDADRIRSFSYFKGAIQDAVKELAAAPIFVRRDDTSELLRRAREARAR